MVVREGYGLQGMCVQQVRGHWLHQGKEQGMQEVQRQQLQEKGRRLLINEARFHSIPLYIKTFLPLPSYYSIRDLL